MGLIPPPRPTPGGSAVGGSVNRALRAHFGPVLAVVRRSEFDRIRPVTEKTGSGPGRGCWVVIFFFFISSGPLFQWITVFFIDLLDFTRLFIVDNSVDSLWISLGLFGFL